ncbi:hypothetical protein LCGC14_0694160 [marine sediment metagenome]|uniref:ClpX-type ZB domain-containing protein n=1 Tax=marine sediment metagenome TaxID=412755 RepID=A0A0F9QPH6_9ZZZZ
MAKVKFQCNHCGISTYWYRSAIHELSYQKIDDKIYCDDCINKIGHKAVDSD